MAIIDVIKCDKPDLMVWKWRPSTLGKRRDELNSNERVFDIRQEELRLGSQLIVNHSQQAIFVKDGQIADVFDAGNHTLSAKNLPILSKLIGIAFGGQSPFKAEVYFINKVVVMDTKFGLMPFNMIEPNFRVPIPVNSRGSFALKVSDSGVFLNKIIGTVKDFESDTLAKQYFRGIITENIKSAIFKITKEQSLNPLELEAIVFEVSEAVKGIISETLTKFGLNLELFNIEAISIINEDEKIQKIVADYHRLMSQDMEERMRLKRRAENLDVYKTERTFDTTEKVAENIGGGIGGDSGNIVGTLIGLGMAQPIANTMGQAVGNLTQNIQQPSPSTTSKEDVLQLLEKLGELKKSGILTEKEFTEKKKELLSKL